MMKTQTLNMIENTVTAVPILRNPETTSKPEENKMKRSILKIK